MYVLFTLLIPLLIAVAAVAIALRWGKRNRQKLEKGEASRSTIRLTSHLVGLLTVSAVVAGGSFGLAHFAADRLLFHTQGQEVQAEVLWHSDIEFRSKSGGSLGTESRIDVETELAYQMNGTQYKVRTMCHDNPPLKIGDQVPLKVNPYDPADYLVLRGTRDQTLLPYQPLIMSVVGVALIGALVMAASWVIALIPGGDSTVPAA